MSEQPAGLPSLIDIGREVGAGERSAVDVTTSALHAMRSRNPALNAFVTVHEQAAIDAAAALDDRVHDGRAVGPLAGVPLGVKDTEDTVGYPTTFGSHLWADAAPATRDSVLVARLKAAGCIVVGKTNTPELAALGVTTNPLYGATLNPYDLSRTSGGSSGGAAVAVAAGMVPLATASDGGGSIRIPASACGLPGFKPSLGRIPDGGPVNVDWLDLTSRGVITRTVGELVAVLDVVVGPDPTDLRSLPAPPVPWSVELQRDAGPVRIGWSPTLGYADVDPSILAVCESAIERLAASAGRNIEVVQVPSVFAADPAFTWITLVAPYLRRSVGRLETALMDPVVRGYLDLADRITTQQLLAAEDECHALNLRLVDVFTRCDLLLTPTLAFDPATLDATNDEDFVKATYPFNLTRSPAGTIPVGRSAANMPVGLQIAGPQHGDVAVLRLMAAFERLALFS